MSCERKIITAKESNILLVCGVLRFNTRFHARSESESTTLGPNTQSHSNTAMGDGNEIICTNTLKHINKLITFSSNKKDRSYRNWEDKTVYVQIAF